LSPTVTKKQNSLLIVLDGLGQQHILLVFLLVVYYIQFLSIISIRFQVISGQVVPQKETFELAISGQSPAKMLQGQKIENSELQPQFFQY